MKYFKNTELAKLYNVSEKTVRNWLAAANTGKLALQLYEERGKQYVANTSHNTELIEDLVSKGKKYKNTRGYRVVRPTAEFYETFSDKEVFDIVTNLEIYREIPHRYSYVNGGAAEWDKYMRKLAAEHTPNILSNTIELLSASTEYLDNLLRDCPRVNVVDLGPGNSYPVRQFLEHFAETGKLNKYVGIDVSQSMLDLSRRNVTEWLGDKVQCETAIRDINYERFNDVISPDWQEEDDATANIVLFLGSTISNFRRPAQALQIIHESIGKNDLLVFSKQLDTIRSRRYFDYGTEPKNPASIISLEHWVIDLLNIDESLYEVDLFYDEKEAARHAEVRFKVAISIEFTVDGKSRIISFNKGESILVWRHRHQNFMNALTQFDENDFELMQAMRSKDQECLLATSRIKTPDSY